MTEWRHLGFQRRKTTHNGSASFQHTGVRDGSHTATQDKGQIFGSGLQLCASGASAEPESVAPYRDQRHPHTVKCQAQRRERESKPKRGGEDKTCFIVVGNLGVARWKGQGSTPSATTHIPQRLLGGNACDNAGTLLPSICDATFSSATSPLLGSLESYWDYVLRFL